MLRERVSLYWYAYRTEIRQTAIWVVPAVVVLSVAISFAIISAKRPNEIAPPLSLYFDAGDSVIMEVVCIRSNFYHGDFVVAYLINNSEANIEIEFIPAKFKIEHYHAGFWRSLPDRGGATRFTSCTVFPGQSIQLSEDFSRYIHRPRHGDLYRLRIAVYVWYGFRYGIYSSHPGIIVELQPVELPLCYGFRYVISSSRHDIVAEFRHGELPLCDSACD